ncbi:MAG: SDR family oxidoreductase, partial [Chloroflexi bacterium]|nr:SDR family oxidoreductase [Chloroflexota bacterium]
LAVACDVSSDGEVEELALRTLDHFGRIDCLVNNAAVNSWEQFADISIKRWDLVLKVNLRGTVLATKAFLPRMIQQRSGRIINVSSGAVTDLEIAAELGIIPYAVSKVAIETLTEGLALELRPRGIAVNCLRIETSVVTEGARLLNPDADSAFSKSGTSDITITGGTIMVNSTSDTASVRSGSGDVTSDGFYYYYEGGWDSTGSSGQYLPEPLPVTSPALDPLATLTPPDPYLIGTSPDSGGTAAAPKAKKLSSGVHVFSPGTYWGGIEIAASADVTFLEGTYVIAGGGFKLVGSGSVTGDGVFFYNTFDPEKTTGAGDCKSVDLRGSAQFNLTAPSSGDYEDILFWQDVNCDEPFKHEGTGDFTGGIIYIPGAEVVFSGSGTVGQVQIIADTVKVAGSADLNIDFFGFLDVSVPAGYKLIE